MADWGDIFGTALGSVAESFMTQPSGFAGPYAGGPVVVGSPAVPGVVTAAGCVTTPGGKYFNPALGKWCYKSPRRRRKRLLTNGDFNDLMRIATLPNNAMTKIALAKAVGR